MTDARQRHGRLQTGCGPFQPRFHYTPTLSPLLFPSPLVQKQASLRSCDINSLRRLLGSSDPYPRITFLSSYLLIVPAVLHPPFPLISPLPSACNCTSWYIAAFKPGSLHALVGSHVYPSTRHSKPSALLFHPSSSSFAISRLQDDDGVAREHADQHHAAYPAAPSRQTAHRPRILGV
jgi:hypothetical protein